MVNPWARFFYIKKLRNTHSNIRQNTLDDNITIENILYPVDQGKLTCDSKEQRQSWISLRLFISFRWSWVTSENSITVRYYLHEVKNLKVGQQIQHLFGTIVPRINLLSHTVIPIGGLIQLQGATLRVLGILASRINPQAHGYHCSFHLRVFQGLSNPQETCVCTPFYSSRSKDSPR